MTVYYVCPYRFVSFGIVANKHIQELRKYTEVLPVPEQDLDRGIVIKPNSTVIVHPLFYVFMGDRDWMYTFRIRRLHRLQQYNPTIIAFDVADTNRISPKAVDLANKVDVVCVPSGWCKRVYIESGVKTRVEVVPHGLSPTFINKPKEITSPIIRKLLQEKKDNDYIYILYFLLHSGYRKGADLVYDAVGQIQQMYDNVILLVKRTEIVDPFLLELRRLRTIEIAGFLNEQHLVELYDIADITIVPSRGGGFELNALESIARGIPTLVTSKGCFEDYLQYTIPIKVAKEEPIFKNNPVHVGNGYTCDIEDFVDKLKNTIENLDEYKARFSQYRKVIVQEYTWENVGRKIWNIIQDRHPKVSETASLPSL